MHTNYVQKSLFLVNCVPTIFGLYELCADNNFLPILHTLRTATYLVDLKYGSWPLLL